MAITVTNKGSLSNSTGSGPYAAILLSAPTANRVQIAFVVNSVNSQGPPGQPTLASTGLTWQAIASVNFGTLATPLRKLTAYRAYGAAPSGTTVNITCPAGPNGGTCTGAAWTFCELTGVDNTGIAGANAIADVTVQASASTGTTLTTLDLGGIVFTGDAVIAGWGLDTASAVTPAESFIEISEATFNSPTARVQSQYKLTYDTTPTATWSISNSAGIAIELKDLANAFKANPKPAETVTVSDTLIDIQVITGAEPALVIPLRSDTVALSDDATVQRWETQWGGTVDLLLMPQRADSLALTDTLTNLTLVGGTTPNVGDSVTLTETSTVKGLILPVLAADLLTITDSQPIIVMPGQSVWAINVNDSVTLTDTPTPHLLTQPQQTDTVTLTDTPVVNLLEKPLVADSTTLTDVVALQLLVNPQAAESVTLTDGVTITGLLILIPPVADLVTLGDSAQGIPTGTVPFDNFDDNAQNSAFWEVAATRAATDALVLVSETAHQLQITPRTNAGAVDAYNGYRAVYPSNYTDGNVFAEIPQVANSATTARTSLVLAIDTANGYDITQEAGQLYFEYEIANLTTVGLQIAYVPTTHRWWRIRHVSAGDTIRYETSPNGTAWTQQLSIARPASLPVTSLQIGVQSGTYASVASPGVAIFDNINLTTLTIFPADSLTLSDTPSVKGLILKALGAETVTLIDGRQVIFGGTLLINRGDTITLTDFSEAELIAPFAELVTVTDSALVQLWMTLWGGTVNLLDMPQRADSVTISEQPPTIILVGVGGPLAPNVPDLVTLTETLTVKGLIPAITTADSVTLTDQVAITGLTLPISVTDLLSPTDTPTVRGLIPAIAAVDSVTLIDQVILTGLTLQVFGAESVTLNDDRTVLIPITGILQIQQADDSVTLTDTAAVTGLILSVSGTDLNSLTDTPTVKGLTLPVSTADTLTLSDVPTVRLALAPISAEQITLSETQTINLLHKPSTADSLTLSDTVTITGLTLPIAAADLITLIEDPTVQIPIAGVLQLQQPEDSVTLTDTTTVTGLTLLLSRADSVTLTDTPTVRLLNKIQVADSVTLTDTRTVKGLIIPVTAADTITISDVASGQLSKLLIARADQVTLSDSRDLLLINQFISQPLIIISIPARDMSITATLTLSQTSTPARDMSVEASPAFGSLMVPSREMSLTASVTISQTSVPARDMSIAA